MLVHFLVHNWTMAKLNIHEAKTHLSAWLDRLERGDEEVVVICRRNEPIAELRALEAKIQLTLKKILPATVGVGGRAARGTGRRDPRFALAPTFFEPLPDELVGAFEGQR